MTEGKTRVKVRRSMKTEILAMLQEETYVSGQAICNRLNVSRTAVWKMINRLREEGYEIEAVPNKGYCLKHIPDVITREACLKEMDTEWVGQNIIYREEVDSTNTLAKKLGEEGAPHGTLVVADMQTRGKGRLGRSWYIPKGQAIAMSLILRPQVEPQYASMLTLVAALAVSRAIDEKTGIRTEIKWPNDIVYQGKKICGILTEMSADMDTIHYVIVGIGINTGTIAFGKELEEKADSLFRITEEFIPRRILIAEVMKRLEYYYEQFCRTKDLSLLRDAYEERLANKNNQVRVLAPGNEYTGTCLGITKDGELLVRGESGAVQTVVSGEVSVRGIYGYV